MPRRINDSHKRRKAQLQNKRAEKRGEEPINPNTKTKATRDFHRSQKSLPGNDNSIRLKSKFLSMTTEYLERTRILAHSTRLVRPIPPSAAVFPIEEMSRDGGRLRCPARPSFKYGQTKKEVERNEEGVFRKWMKETEEIVRDWVEGQEDIEVKEGEEVSEKETDELWPRSPSWFETNLEVWRQLWRVTEASSIILLLLDSRCPPLHCPPSLKAHVQSLKPAKEVVLVLTKADLVDATALEGWKAWAKAWWGTEVEVVSVMSYDLAYLNESGRHRPDIPVQSLQQLLSALERCHERLLQPPQRIRDDPTKLSSWVPPVRNEVDWNGLISHTHDHKSHEVPPEDLKEVEVPGKQNGPLTIGLIGQPNVGKSSLLNALLGEQRVRASKTPGKTKHFQTIFWGDKKEVKMVDCPGLVCPSLIGLELQALAGILPISQIPSLPACIYEASTLLPLEEIFRVPIPESNSSDPYAAKKTWREPKQAVAAEQKVEWTAGSIMEGRALDRGYLTAKGGRPDGNRAANGIMRNLADGRIRWGFWPPDADLSGREGKGIWLDSEALVEDYEGNKSGPEEAHDTDEPLEGSVDESEGEDELHGLQDWASDEGLTDESEDDEAFPESKRDDADDEIDEDDDEEEDVREAKPGQAKLGGFFAALDVEDGGEDVGEEVSGRE